MDISSGVKGYIIGRCEVQTGFPIDLKDRYHIACKYCRFFIGKRCVITDEIVPWPESYTGNECPFKFELGEYDDEE